MLILMLAISSLLFGSLVNDYEAGTVESVKLYKSRDLNEQEQEFEKSIIDNTGIEKFFSHFSKSIYNKYRSSIKAKINNIIRIYLVNDTYDEIAEYRIIKDKLRLEERYLNFRCSQESFVDFYKKGRKIR